MKVTLRTIKLNLSSIYNNSNNHKLSNNFLLKQLWTLLHARWNPSKHIKNLLRRNLHRCFNNNNNWVNKNNSKADKNSVIPRYPTTLIQVQVLRTTACSEVVVSIITVVFCTAIQTTTITLQCNNSIHSITCIIYILQINSNSNNFNLFLWNLVHLLIEMPHTIIHAWIAQNSLPQLYQEYSKSCWLHQWWKVRKIWRMLK